MGGWSQETKPAFRMFDLHMPKKVQPGASQFLSFRDAASRKPGIDLLNGHNTEFILNTLIVKKPFLFPILQNTPKLEFCFTPVISFSSSSSFGSSGRECIPDQLL